MTSNGKSPNAFSALVSFLFRPAASTCQLPAMLKTAKTISPWTAPTWWKPRSEPAAGLHPHPQARTQPHPYLDRDDLCLRLV